MSGLSMNLFEKFGIEPNNEDYYETLYEIFNGNKNTKATLFLGKINITKTINSLEKKLKSINCIYNTIAYVNNNM